MISDVNAGVQLNIQGSSTYTTLISMVAALGAVMFGFDVAIISGAAPFVQRHFELNDLQLGWGVSSLIIGCMAGALVAGRLADLYGRKRTLLFVASIFGISSALAAIAPSFTLFVVARIAGGLAVGAASMVAPMYIAEASPCGVRGRMVALNQLGITFGILLSYLINYLLRDLGPNNWRWMFASGALPSLAFFVLLFLVPESPRWLYLAGRRNEAEAVLVRIGGTENANTELASMHAPDRQAAGGLSELLHRKHRRVMMVGILLAILVQATGINTVIEYSPIILRSAGNNLDSAMFQTFVMGFINFLATFVAIFTVDRLGRRSLYLYGACGMTISLVAISLGFLTGSNHGLVGLFLILMFIASFAACVGPVFWILMSEIFPGRIRGLAMSAAVFVCWAANFVVVLLFPWVLRHFGGAATFGSVAVLALGMVYVAWKMVPETSGKTLEQIEAHWESYGTR